MGGKLWSYLEERFFWTEVVPRSDKRVGADRVNHVKMTWAQLAEMMQIRMGRDALRVYTCNSLLEHWFKNVKKRQFSQYAHDFVTAYLAQMAENEPKREGEAASTQQENGDEEVDMEIPQLGQRLRAPTPHPAALQGGATDDEDMDDRDNDETAESPHNIRPQLLGASPVEANPIVKGENHNQVFPQFVGQDPGSCVRDGRDREAPYNPGVPDALPQYNLSGGYQSNAYGASSEAGSSGSIRNIPGQMPRVPYQPDANCPHCHHYRYSIHGNGHPHAHGTCSGGYNSDFTNRDDCGPGCSSTPHIPHSCHVQGYNGGGSSRDDHGHLDHGYPGVLTAHQHYLPINRETRRQEDYRHDSRHGLVPPALQSMIEEAVASAISRYTDSYGPVHNVENHSQNLPPEVAQAWARTHPTGRQARQLRNAALGQQAMIPHPPAYGNEATLQAAASTSNLGAAPGRAGCLVPTADIAIPSIETDPDQPVAIAGRVGAGPTGGRCKRSDSLLSEFSES